MRGRQVGRAQPEGLTSHDRSGSHSRESIPLDSPANPKIEERGEMPPNLGIHGRPERLWRTACGCFHWQPSAKTRQPSSVDVRQIFLPKQSLNNGRQSLNPHQEKLRHLL